MAPNRRFSSICKTAGHDKLFVRNMNQVIRLRVILKKKILMKFVFKDSEVNKHHHPKYCSLY